MTSLLVASARAVSLETSSETRRHIRGSSLLLSGRMLALGMNFVTHFLIVRYLKVYHDIVLAAWIALLRGQWQGLDLADTFLEHSRLPLLVELLGTEGRS